jgi:predicted aldo/keto reductase-like oxidoreductase
VNFKFYLQNIKGNHTLYRKLKRTEMIFRYWIWLFASSKDIGVMIMEPLREGSTAIKVPLEIKSIWEQADSGGAGDS